MSSKPGMIFSTNMQNDLFPKRLSPAKRAALQKGILAKGQSVFGTYGPQKVKYFLQKARHGYLRKKGLVHQAAAGNKHIACVMIVAVCVWNLVACMQLVFAQAFNCFASDRHSAIFARFVYKHKPCKRRHSLAKRQSPGKGHSKHGSQ